MARRFDFGEPRAATKPAKRPKTGPPGRGQWAFRVVFKREEWSEKRKKFGREGDAVRYYKMLLSGQPWLYLGRSGRAPDDEHQCRRNPCLCQQGKPIDGEKLGTLAHFNRMLAEAWPPLEYCRLERRWMQPWEDVVLAWEPEPMVERPAITDPRRLLPKPRRLIYTEEELEALLPAVVTVIEARDDDFDIPF